MRVARKPEPSAARAWAARRHGMRRTIVITIRAGRERDLLGVGILVEGLDEAEDTVGRPHGHVGPGGHRPGCERRYR